MMKSPHHNLPFHMVQMSPWPIFTAASTSILTLSMVKWFYSMMSDLLLFMPMILLLMITHSWWLDVVRESTFMGEHSQNIQTTMAISMILFIASEVMFFSAFFWTFFHSSLSPIYDIGCEWPPKGTLPLNPFAVPLLNTGVLLMSGVTVTWSHNALISEDPKEANQALSYTLMLGAYFTYLQLEEYMTTEFSFNDSTFGSVFFLATGFHGCHVIIGTLFLWVCSIRMQSNHFNSSHHMGFEMAAWYWHFVDVVWLYLFMCMYWWNT